jgi:sugar lactone lactonase YvrE
VVAGGVGGGIAFDPSSNAVFVSFPKVRMIYRISAALEDPRQWTSIFGNAESIGSLAVDAAGRRLLVGESFSGIVYSLALDSRQQGTVAHGLGSVNSLSVDRERKLVYIADSGRRTIWVSPLAGDGNRSPTVFYRSDELAAVTGVAADGQSNVWVGVYSPAKVIVLDRAGRQLDVME